MIAILVIVENINGSGASGGGRGGGRGGRRGGGRCGGSGGGIVVTVWWQCGGSVVAVVAVDVDTI